MMLSEDFDKLVGEGVDLREIANSVKTIECVRTTRRNFSGDTKNCFLYLSVSGLTTNFVRR